MSPRSPDDSNPYREGLAIHEAAQAQLERELREIEGEASSCGTCGRALAGLAGAVQLPPTARHPPRGWCSPGCMLASSKAAPSMS